ncbi:GntR family transcriptional regulator [Hoeflea poritis]|uniref:GntR family transcriptional regulator n=1 Tax=Hoeflea poritis TaxID=2993659 RepID=A0ABT4VNR5_9HYPH|nr:GntR family transcriptional regulator [Hoeflea poritis]MDA4846350.1 GntR family transcriptional regulator [Hoeflea poritis]
MKDEARARKARCYADMKRKILTMAMEPGSDIDEAALSQAYEISRPPFREVLRQLAGEGYVTLVENRGAKVSAMNHKTLRDFFVAAPMIYSAVSQLAAQNATDLQIQKLKETQRQFRAAIASGDVAARALNNERFHAIIGEMADNIYLQPSLTRLLIDHARIGMTFYQPRSAHMAENLNTAAEQHDRFIALIEAGDAEAVARLAVDHWELSRNQIEIYVTPAGLDIPLDVARAR